MKRWTQWAIAAAVLSIGAELVQAQQSYAWRYYRPGNTGIQGDYNESIYIGADGDPWIGGYNPVFEEGGVARFVQAENRWVNVSNVDYPVIGHPDDVGTTRVSDMVEDGQGNLWMGTWRGALRMNLAIGPSSLVKFGPGNSAFPGGRTRDMTFAPDGTLWISAESASWGGGGLTRYNPATDTWTHMDGHGGGRIAAQPKPDGGYYLWTALGGFDGMARWNSTTQAWNTYTFGPGKPAALVSLDSADAAGNVWMMRWIGNQGEQRLDCLRPDGTWLSPALPPPHPQIPVAALRAFGNLQALMVDGYAHLHRFNGSSWTDLGAVPHNGFIDDLDIDAAGNVWLCGTGTGGALRRDAVTGFWQRYRVTNTSQFDFFNQDLTIDEQTGDVYACANASADYGGMVKFDGTRWTGFVNGLGYGLTGPWPFPGAPQSEAVCVRPSNGHVVVNPINNYTNEYDGTSWTSIPGGPDQMEQYVEDSLGRLWGMGHYGGLGMFENGGYTLVDMGGWGGRLQKDPDRPGTVWANEDWTILRTDGTYKFSRSLGDFPDLIGTSPTFGGLAADHDGVVWVGCSLQNAAGDVGGGLIRLDADTGAYTVLKSFDGWPFPGQYVYPWKVTPDGKVWMMYEGGTFPDFQHGLCWYDGTSVGVFPAPPGGEPQWGGLPHAAVEDLELRVIPGGYELWMSCLSRGIAVLTVSGDPTWTDLGHGKSGSAGTPALVGTGTLAAGSRNAVDLTSARPSSIATLVFGLSQIDAPFKGGTLVPLPLLLIPLGTNASGAASLPFTWPAGVPAGTAIYLQHWIQDAAASNGFSASNGLQGVTP